HWITTEAEITVVLGIAERPAADPWGECADREDSCRGARQGGCLGARHGGLCRRLLDEEGSGRFRRGAAICPDGIRNGDPLNLSDRNQPAGQSAENDADGAWDTAVATAPTSKTPRANGEPPGDAALWEVKCDERRADFGCGQVACLYVQDYTSCPPARVRRARGLDHVQRECAPCPRPKPE